MTIESRDEWIAEHMIGWVRPKRRTIGETWYSPEGYGASRKSWPSFTTTTDADYQVLVKVRSDWTYTQKAAFMEELSRVLSRRRIETDRPLSTSDFLHYEPGDYSLAAFFAMEDDRP